jgi:hypothetical protein
MKASSAADFLVTLSGFPFDIPGSWAQQGGGNKSAEPRRYREGGTRTEEIGGGPTSRDNITVGRPFKADRDVIIGRAADQQAGRARGTITKQPLDEDGNAFGDPLVYPDSLLLSCTWPDTDADALDTTARIELALAPGELV